MEAEINICSTGLSPALISDRTPQNTVPAALVEDPEDLNS
jgi:hypothetical protein